MSIISPSLTLTLPLLMRQHCLFPCNSTVSTSRFLLLPTDQNRTNKSANLDIFNIQSHIFATQPAVHVRHYPRICHSCDTAALHPTRRTLFPGPGNILLHIRKQTKKQKSEENFPRLSPLFYSLNIITPNRLTVPTQGRTTSY